MLAGGAARRRRRSPCASAATAGARGRVPFVARDRDPQRRCTRCGSWPARCRCSARPGRSAGRAGSSGSSTTCTCHPRRACSTLVRPPAARAGCNLYYATHALRGALRVPVWLFVRHREALPPGPPDAGAAHRSLPADPARPGRSAAVAARLHRHRRASTDNRCTASASAPTSCRRCPRCTSAGRCSSPGPSSRSAAAAGGGSAAHPVPTVFVVVATANHFWLDGIVAVVCYAVVCARTPARGVTARPAMRVDGRQPNCAGGDRRSARGLPLRAAGADVGACRLSDRSQRGAGRTGGGRPPFATAVPDGAGRRGRAGGATGRCRRRAGCPARWRRHRPA